MVGKTGKVQKVTGVAAYRQIAEKIRLMVTSGEYKPGDKMPSETELMALFGVTRPTVNAAAQLLREEGLLYVEWGRGTFVSEPPEEIEPELLVDYVLSRIEQGDVMLFRDPDGGFDRVNVARPASPDEKAARPVPSGNGKPARKKAAPIRSRKRGISART